MSKNKGVAHFEQAVRLDAWRAVFEKTNRIISERPVTVAIVDGAYMGMHDVPAWTNGEAISFNGPQVAATLKGKDPISSVLALKGLNYHELCHVLYTPRLGDELPRLVQKRMKDDSDPTYWFAFNALEDQRIETWFTSVFTASRRYFEATIMNWIVTDATVEAAPLIYGRKYLSSTIRIGAGNVFVQKHGQTLYDEMKDVIDQYVLVTLPAQSAKAYGLVVQFHHLLVKMMMNAPLPSLPIPDNGCHNGGPHRNGVSRDEPSAVRAGRVIQKVQRQAAEAAAKTMEAAAEADKQAQANQPAPKQDMPMPDVPQDGPTLPGDGSDGSDAGTDQGAGTEPASGGSGGQQDDGSGAPVQTESTQSSQGDGAGTAGSDITAIPSTMKDLMDAAAEAFDKIQADPQIVKDAEAVLDQVKATAQNSSVQVEGGTTHNQENTTEATEPMKVASRRVQHILAKVRADLEPSKMRNQSSGRINVRKFLTRRPAEVEIFDIWDEGAEEEASVEAVILMDCSGSMRRRMPDALGATWALKRAFDKLEIRTTVMAYNGRHKVLYQPSHKAKAGIPNLSADGGTEPSSAYEQATRIFMKTGAANKILVNVTDGGWAQPDEHYAAIMKTLHALGVSTMLLGLDEAVKNYGKHSHKVGHDISSVNQLPKAVTIWVGDILRQVGARG